MKKIKLLTGLVALPILGMTTTSLTSCKVEGRVIFNCSSRTITFTNLPKIWKEEDGDISATYTYDTETLKFDQDNSDILVATKSIKSEEGVEYKDGNIKIPASLITGPVAIKILVVEKASYSIVNCSDSGVTVTGLGDKWTEGEGDIAATYSYDSSSTKLDETDCDILVGSQSIKSEEGVVYKDGNIKIPASLITNNITIKIALVTKNTYKITNASSEGVTITGLPEKWTEGGTYISARYTIDSNVKFDDDNTDILVGTISIKSQPYVICTNGHIFIPSIYIFGDITVKIATCAKPGVLDNTVDEIITACNTYESKRDKDAFIKSFKINGTELTSINTLIGSTFNIDINSKSHVVRIIDFEHDDMYDETTKLTTGKAALTFELVTLLSDESGNKKTTKWDSIYNYDYTNSILRYNLNGTYSGTTKPSEVWTNTALSMLPSNINSNVKNVQKTVGISKDSGGSYAVTAFSDKLFPLSYTETGWTDGMEQAKVEGTVYKYWNGVTDKNLHKKTDVNGQDQFYAYWLRSPYAGEIPVPEYVWYVDDQGGIFNFEYGPDDTLGISFAFCI